MQQQQQTYHLPSLTIRGYKEKKDPQRAPLWERQAVYFATGSVGGTAALLTGSFAHQKLLPPTLPAHPVTSGTLKHAVGGAGMRFLAFDLCRDYTKDKISNPVLRGGISGCVGGLTETVSAAFAGALASRSFSPVQSMGPTLATHGATTFACFSGYALIATTFFKDQQPPPAPFVFLIGATSGSFGVPIINAIRTRTLRGYPAMALSGFIRIGTVIGIQVNSSHYIMEWLEGRRIRDSTGT